MSQSRDITYTCPYCGKEFTITVYDSVNVSQDPDLRDRCITGDVFRHSCPHCHKDFMIQNPLLYMDPEHKFVIWVSEEENIRHMEQLVEPLKKAGYTLRRCPVVKQFVEKIAVLEDGVDDVMVELAKYDSFIEYIDNRKGNPQDVSDVRYEYTKDDIMKITIVADDKSMSFLIPTEALKAEIEAEADVFKVDDEDFPCINGDWMISLFAQAEGKAQVT